MDPAWGRQGRQAGRDDYWLGAGGKAGDAEQEQEQIADSRFEGVRPDYNDQRQVMRLGEKSEKPRNQDALYLFTQLGIAHLARPPS